MEKQIKAACVWVDKQIKVASIWVKDLHQQHIITVSSCPPLAYSASQLYAKQCRFLTYHQCGWCICVCSLTRGLRLNTYAVQDLLAGQSSSFSSSSSPQLRIKAPASELHAYAWVVGMTHCLHCFWNASQPCNLEQDKLHVFAHPACILRTSAYHIRFAYYIHTLSMWRVAGAHPTDVRMTTRFKEHDLTEGLTGAIHETGHSLYEQVWVMFLGFRVCS